MTAHGEQGAPGTAASSRRRLLACALFLAASRATAASREAPRSAVAVLFPDVAQPFRGVFTAIIEGLAAATSGAGTLLTLPVPDKVDVPELLEQVRQSNIQVLIALGRNGLRAATAIDGRWPIVAGAVLSLPEAQARNLTVHTLAPDPALLLSRLLSMAPAVRRVFATYSPGQNEWLARRARQAAASRGIDLQMHRSESLQEAMQFYKQFFAAASSPADALWLPQDSVTVDDSNVLPLVLQDSWTRRAIVISSTVSHVRRGVLMGLYPDTPNLGRALAESASQAISQPGYVPLGLLPLQQVLAAVNIRTAEHLGLASAAAAQPFDLIFPDP